MSKGKELHARDVDTVVDSQPQVAVDRDPVGDILARPVTLKPPASFADRPEARPLTSVDGVIVGKIVSLGDFGEVLVDYPGNPSGAPLTAISTRAFRGDEAGIEVALLFEAGDPRRPIVVAPIFRPCPPAHYAEPAPRDSEEPSLDVTLDGESLTLSAKKEIVLQCGKASITLTKAGKILLRGTYLLSRSSGVNRVKGGSVQIN